MRGYVSYFTEHPRVRIGDEYMGDLMGYNARAKEVMLLVRFKQIRSAFHPETGVTACNDSCHQL